MSFLFNFFFNVITIISKNLFDSTKNLKKIKFFKILRRLGGSTGDGKFVHKKRGNGLGATPINYRIKERYSPSAYQQIGVKFFL
jgi:hypothetical protein